MNGNFKTISALKPVSGTCSVRHVMDSLRILRMAGKSAERTVNSGFAEYRADIRRAVNALRFEQKRPAEVKKSVNGGRNEKIIYIRISNRRAS